jgi:hypothetical protein
MIDVVSEKNFLNKNDIAFGIHAFNKLSMMLFPL